MKRFEYEIIFDYHDKYGFFPDEENFSEMFVGTSEELDSRVRDLRDCGCRNIRFSCLQEHEEFEEEYVDPWERAYIRSVSGGDYSSANPWDAPGMSVSDFI